MNYKSFPAFLLLMICCAGVYAQHQKVWIDADTGNETDDVYAIVRLLKASSVQIIGVSSAHFNNPDLLRFKKWNQYNTKGINTVKISQELNQKILTLCNRTEILHPIGADRQMGRGWGGSEPRASAASAAIISNVKKLKPGEKLDIICLGALTNLASAIAIDTTIKKTAPLLYSWSTIQCLEPGMG